MIYFFVMEEMIAKWIRETIDELEKARKQQNTLKMIQMKFLKDNLIILRDKLAKLFS